METSHQNVLNVGFTQNEGDFFFLITENGHKSFQLY